MQSAGRGLWASLLSVVLVVAGHGGALAGEGADHEHGSGSTAEPVVSASWENQFKEQIAREDAAEGRAGHRDQVDAAMQKLMDEISKGSNEHAEHTGGNGPFSGMGAMQQMDRSFFLGPVANAESVTGVGACPKNAPVREFDISAINIEITLNQWLDYHPGYMYVLTENVEKARQEEKTNREARKKPGYDPGAVSAGLQTDIIQPLNIRGN